MHIKHQLAIRNHQLGNKHQAISNRGFDKQCRYLLRVVFFLYFIFYISFFISCSSSSRDRSRIPETPTEKNIQNFSEIAIETLGDAISSNSAVSENYYKRAALLLKVGRLAEALEDIEQANELDPNTAKYLFLEALILRDLEKHKEALSAARNAELLGFDTPDLYTLLGDLSLRTNNFNDADRYLGKSLEMSPYNGDAFYYKGIASAKLGDTTSAIMFLDNSVAFKPRNLKTYQAYTDIYAGQKDYQMALTYNAKGLSLFRDDIDLLVGRGLLMQRIGRADSALVYYARVNRIQPKYFQTYLYAAGIYYRWRSYQKSIEYYQLVKQHNPEYKPVDYLLGICYEKAGGLAQAETYFQRAVALEPKNANYQYALNRVQARLNYELGLSTYISPKYQKYYADTSSRIISQKLLDTTRIKIGTIQPKARVNIKTDSVRRIRIN